MMMNMNADKIKEKMMTSLLMTMGSATRTKEERCGSMKTLNKSQVERKVENSIRVMELSSNSCNQLVLLQTKRFLLSRAKRMPNLPQGSQRT
jgi:hypothetical protein